MVMERISMNLVIDVLKLHYQDQCSNRGIAKRLGISRPTVQKYLDLTKEAGIDQWPVQEEEDGGVGRLRKILFPESTVSSSGAPLPEWSEVEKELNARKKSGVTRHLLWQEYRMAHPDGLGYSQFCAHFAEYRKKRDLRMHVPHAPAEELYVDYSGPKVWIYPVGKDPFQASIFVAVMGLSAYTFLYATPDMKTRSWIRAHRETFEYLGGVPKAIIPDCTKTAVLVAHRYDPALNRTYREMSAHYTFEIAPARPLSPRDKGAVETGVLSAQRALLAPIREVRFVSLSDLNRTLRERCDAFNQTPFQKRPNSRMVVFGEEDRPALGALPSEPFETEEWIVCRVHPDYHISVDRFLYSVPCRLVREQVDVRLTATTLEIFHREERVASHLRTTDPRKRFSTFKEHMPPNHRHYLDQSQEGYLERAGKAGPDVVRFIEALFRRRQYPAYAYRTCQGILSLLKEYPAHRVNAACALGLQMGTGSYKALEGILKHEMDRKALTPETKPSVPDHENVRGPAYYGGKPESTPGPPV